MRSVIQVVKWCSSDRIIMNVTCFNLFISTATVWIVVVIQAIHWNGQHSESQVTNTRLLFFSFFSFQATTLFKRVSLFPCSVVYCFHFSQYPDKKIIYEKEAKFSSCVRWKRKKMLQWFCWICLHNFFSR